MQLFYHRTTIKEKKCRHFSYSYLKFEEYDISELVCNHKMVEKPCNFASFRSTFVESSCFFCNCTYGLHFIFDSWTRYTLSCPSSLKLADFLNIWAIAGVDAPLAQSFFTYTALVLVYGSIMLYRRQKPLVQFSSFILEFSGTFFWGWIWALEINLNLLLACRFHGIGMIL